MRLIDHASVEVDATSDGDRLLVDAEGFARATGWELKPEGLCRGEVCVPVRDDVRSGTMIDLHAAAEALGRALVVAGEVQGVARRFSGERTPGAETVAALAGDPMGAGQRASIDELELPDLDGNTVHLSAFAGRKRLLVAWASW